MEKPQRFQVRVATDPKVAVGETVEGDVVEDEYLGGDPESSSSWAYRGRRVLSVDTDIPVGGKDVPTREILDAVEDSLREHGWVVEGDWEGFDHGHVATVVKRLRFRPHVGAFSL